jgi:hypothetical protein
VAKKKSTRKKAAVKGQKLFSLAAVHRELTKARTRLAGQTQTAASRKLAQDLKNAQLMMACGQTMSPDIA